MSFSRKNVPLFIALAPLVCASAVVLLQWSVVGILIAVGVFGLLGLVGLIWSWLGLLCNKTTSALPTARVILLSAGLFAAMFGVMGFESLGSAKHPDTVMPIILLAQWSAIYAVLSFAFMFSQAVSRWAIRIQERSWLKGYRFIAIFWIVSAAVSVLPYQWAEARIKTNFDNSEPEVKARVFRENAFASAYCRDDLNGAATALKRQNAVPNEAVLLEAISECYSPRGESVLNPGSDERKSLKKEKIKVALDAIVGYEREHPVPTNDVCTNLRTRMLVEVYSRVDLDALELLGNNGFSLHCRSEYASSKERPVWFLFVTRGNLRALNVDQLKRLQAMGIDLNERDGDGAHFLDWWNAQDASPEVMGFLAQQGIVPPHP